MRNPLSGASGSGSLWHRFEVRRTKKAARKKNLERKVEGGEMSLGDQDGASFEKKAL